MQIVVNPLIVPTYDSKHLRVITKPENRTIDSPVAEERCFTGGRFWRVHHKQVWSMWSSYFIPAQLGDQLLQEVRSRLDDLAEKHQDMNVTLSRMRPVLDLHHPKTWVELTVCQWEFDNKDFLTWGAVSGLSERLDFGDRGVLQKGGEFLYVGS